MISVDEINLLHNKICRSFGDPTRIQILYALCNHPCQVSVLSQDLDLPQSTTSRHLAILRQSGLITAQRDGASMIYQLADAQIIDILDSMRQLLRKIMTRQSNALE